MRSTSENITELKENEIFVFGSNIQGNHAGGAARTAVEKFGAIMGQGVGLQGQSYAIPTMEGLESLIKHVNEFIEFTKNNPQLTFYLTKVGCGIAGYEEHRIKPLFSDTPSNVIKPEGWNTSQKGTDNERTT